MVITILFFPVLIQRTNPLLLAINFYLANRKKIAGKRNILSGNTLGNTDNNFISIKFNELTSGIFFDNNYTKIGSTVYNCV